MRADYELRSNRDSAISRIMCRTMMALIGLACFATDGLPADELIESVSKRYEQPSTQPTPDFQRHVIPLLGRLGCNGRDCHGSFQGQGGFRLSLFGYGFGDDLAALTGSDTPRVDREHPAQSLLLRKPTTDVDHEGGQRFKKGSWEYHLLRRWVESGAKGLEGETAELTKLEVEPAEIIFGKNSNTASLRITAHWADGRQEDVTPLCRFQTNDESIATVSDSAVVQSIGTGDTHVIVFYDNGISAIPVIRPVDDRIAENYPNVPTPSMIDRLVTAKLRKVGIVPAKLCTDAEFLRRTSLDITGTLPTPTEIEEFLSDQTKNKRSRKIGQLLDRPSYAAWMTTRLCDWTGNAEENLPVGGEQGVRRDKSALWYDWIYRRIENNTPYDEIVDGIMMAVGRGEDQSEAEYFEEMTSYFREQNPANFADRETMPYFWTRGRFTPPQTLRLGYAFLGVRLECAQCHKHPYDQWTQADYEDFQIFFKEVRFRQSATRGHAGDLKKKLGLTADQDSGGYKRLFAQLAHEGTVVPWGDVVAANWKTRRDPLRNAKSPAGRVITPRVLGGEEVVAKLYSDPREPVMQWLRSPDNPYFARTIVNRIWAGYFGTGIVNPPDDMNLANPPSNEPLLTWLAEQFVANNYDLKWLHRTITNSRTYQLSWRPNESNQYDERNFSRALVRRLPAELTYDALVFATSTVEFQRRMQMDKEAVLHRQIGFPTSDRASPARYATSLFGKPKREQVCECERSSEPSLLQTVYLRNDADVRTILRKKGNWLDSLQQSEQQTDVLIREIWLRTFSRPPTSAELQIGRERLEDSEDRADGLRDLLWATINSKEFLLNH